MAVVRVISRTPARRAAATARSASQAHDPLRRRCRTDGSDSSDPPISGFSSTSTTRAARFRRRQRRRRSPPRRRPTTSTSRVQVAVGVAVGVGFARRLAQTRRGADEGFVHLVPEAARPHEGLVVEARRKQHVGRSFTAPMSKDRRGHLFCEFGVRYRRRFLHGGAGVRFEPTAATATCRSARSALPTRRRQRRAGGDT